jgi:hypothetical protein
MPRLAPLCLAAALLAALPAAADDAARDRPRPVALKVKESIEVCKTGAVICPAVAPICDDNSVATIRDEGKGLEIVGLKAGQTLCSVMSANQARQVFAVTVR